MRVRELTLTNFRVFGEPEPFVFADRVTVIAGVNGRGKTAMLDALALLASRLLPLISPARSGYRTIPKDRTWKAKLSSAQSSRQKTSARSSLRNSESWKNASALKQRG